MIDRAQSIATILCGSLVSAVRFASYVSLLSKTLRHKLSVYKSTNAGTSSSAAMQNGVMQASEQWVENAKREQLRKEEEQARRERLRRTVC